MSSGQISMTLSNETPDGAQFDLWKLDEGHEYEELAAHIAEEHRRLKAGEPGLGHPTFATQITSQTVHPGAHGALAVDLDAGIYGIACIRVELQPEKHPDAIYVAGPFEF